MPDPATGVLVAVVAAGLVYVLGVDRTASAAGTAASGTKRAVTSGYTAGIAGAGLGMQLGYQLLQTAMMEPFAVSTAIAGIAGALGIEGYLGDLTGVQFLLIGFSIFLAVTVYNRRVR